MTRYSSEDSDSGRKRSSRRSKKKSRSKRRSRSSSSDRKRSRDSRRHSRSRSRDSRRRSRSRSRDSRRRSRSRSRDSRRRSRSRSRSDDSYYSRRKRSSSRSRGRRSRSTSRDRYSRKRRSRSRSREKSKKGRRSRNRSYSRERSSKKKPQQPKVATVKQKDPCEDIPGFSDMTPAQQNRLRVQAAFKALDTVPALDATATSSTTADTALDHMERAQVIADIDEEGFMPTHFSSSRTNKASEPPKTNWPSNLIDQEDYHEMAIFGNSGALALDEQSKKQISDATEAITPKKVMWKDRDPKSIAHPNLHISKEEADERWIERLQEMRKNALQTMT